MDLHLLRSFREVARERSFTAAAKNLLLTQPAVSQQVKALEKEVGEKLLDRAGRTVTPTPAGLVLLEAADRVFALLDDALRRVKETRTSDAGTVTIACGDTVALYLLPPVLSEFRARFPKADVAVRNHGSREVMALLLEGGADLGVATAPPHLDPALESAPLLEERFLLALPPRHPKAAAGPASAAELEGEPAVLLAKPSVTRSLIDRGLRDAGVTVVPVMESGNLEVVKAYVARGIGLSFLPEMAVTEDDRRRMAVHPVPGPFPRRRLVVLRRQDRFRTRLAKELTELLAAHVRPRRGGKRGGDPALGPT
jgi:DNA-binding transcriptional LysR family regulator